MLTKTCFDRCMNTILTFSEVSIDADKNKAFYNLMKNDFSDDEFKAMSEDICKTELLYGRYPAPKLFYDRKKQSNERGTIFIEEGSFYLDDTMPQYRAVIADLDQDTRDRICNNVAQWLLNNKRGELVSEQFIIERLKQFRPTPIDYEEPMTLTEIKKLIADHKGE